MDEKKEFLNHFLVVTFNDILRFEEMALEHLSNHRLSISEIHVLEAVFDTLLRKENTATNIARQLRITTGSLTTAMKTLELKGYLLRHRDETDKRVIHVLPTPIAEFVNQKHAEFHRQMIDGVVAKLTLEEEKILADALVKIQDYFHNQADQTKQLIAGEKE